MTGDINKELSDCVRYKAEYDVTVALISNVGVYRAKRMMRRHVVSVRGAISSRHMQAFIESKAITDQALANMRLSAKGSL